MAPTADPQVAAVVAAYQSQESRLRRRALAFVAAAWAAMRTHRDADVDRFVAQIVSFMESAQAATAALTAGYLGLLERVVLGATEAAVTPAALSSTAALRGVPAEVLWRRPGVEVWTLLSTGVPYPEAARRGGQRAQSIGATNLQLAKTHAARHAMANNPRIVGYRRVLSGPSSCGLCVVASTQRYHKADLLPLHSACDCNVIPIYGDKDPGQVIDPDRLAGVHRQIEERFGKSDRSAKASSYREQLVVHDHSEIGPVLGVRGQHFAGAPV